MHRTVVLNIVGLTPSILRSKTPRLAKWAESAAVATIKPAFPAVTCTAQANYLTGRTPAEHGIVGNGWYVRDECEVRFWRQSNKLVQAPKIWDTARAADPKFTCANVFWWFNMYSDADYTVTPRPMYPADGRKLPDVYTVPANLRVQLQEKLGTFPLFNFWGPRASIESSAWIAESAKYVEQQYTPTLSLVYLPHLDYNLQRVGPTSPAAAEDMRQIDDLAADLIAFYEARGIHVVVLSEYGLCDVTTPVHLNRVLRQQGFIAIREELGLELLDAGASAAFAVADHQVAHVYVKNPSDLNRVRAAIEQTPGVERVLDAAGKRAYGIDHPRAGELVAIAKPEAWFTYYYWLDDERAPDFARTVDIHRKPGYDPVELFLDPAIRIPALTVGAKLAKKALGFRMLMNVIPVDATLVKGSHGRTDVSDDGPLIVSKQRQMIPADTIDSIAVHDIILAHLGIGGPQVLGFRSSDVRESGRSERSRDGN